MKENIYKWSFQTQSEQCTSGSRSSACKCNNYAISHGGKTFNFSILKDELKFKYNNYSQSRIIPFRFEYLASVRMGANSRYCADQ